MSTRPAPTEYAPYFARYVDLVPEDDICITLKEQGSATESILRLLNDKQASYRYAPDKWSVKQLVGHVTDSERIFGRSEEHTSELQSRGHLVCRLLLEKKKKP